MNSFFIIPIIYGCTVAKSKLLILAAFACRKGVVSYKSHYKIHRMAGAWLLQLDPEKPQPKTKGYFSLTQKKNTMYIKNLILLIYI